MSTQTHRTAVEDPSSRKTVHTGDGAPPLGFLRIGPAEPAKQILTDRQQPFEALCQEAGLDAGAFDDPDALVSYQALGRFLQLAAARSGLGHFGLLVGCSSPPSSLGLVGFLAQNAPTVGAAIADLTEYLHFQGRGGIPVTSADGDAFTIGYTPLDASMPGADDIAEMAMGVLYRMLGKICGDAWSPLEVRICRERPAEPALFWRLLNAPVRFNSDHTALSFQTRWLDAQVAGADPALYRYLRRQVEAMHALESQGFTEEVRRTIRLRLRDRAPCADDIAKALRINKRTLTRRLAAEGSSFSALLSETRYDIAQHLLRTTSIPLSEVALLLGYSEASALTRAFRDWSGVNPQQWRVQHRFIGMRAPGPGVGD
ncbi:putative transcriptional regulatory, AraC family protein [Alsobacter metallidurans]|uniref:Transcriptional regulatory, AraC family protein n=1 Tax=Alsobacter metallidurans TaxID=340221 RepID=A0A917IAQ6_9HYPH|nr:AraC family transcriptional regulator [Alsobacter metallidurans]GGH26988.1 putative transcriptional regulatory, AraC family protein [Alsobacter metallidurans]